MESTRHERAATVVASYVIGFTTAFMFASQATTLLPDPFTSLPVSNSASVAAAVVPAPATPTAVAEVEPSTFAVGETAYSQGRLVYTGTDGERLLSHNPDVSDLSADLATLTQGYHYGELSYVASADGKFVFFCEQQSKAADDCLTYVYDTNADRIFQVSEAGEPVILTNVEAKAVIWTAVGLKVGSSYSVNTSAPWVLAKQ